MDFTLATILKSEIYRLQNIEYQNVTANLECLFYVSLFDTPKHAPEI